MAVPKKRMSRSQRDQRRAHDAIRYALATELCSECGELKLRHRLCEGCGTYRGRKLIEVGDAE